MSVIIDSHAHVGGSWMGKVKNPYTPERMKEIMQSFGVRYACVSTWDVLNDIERGNADVCALAKRDPFYIPYVVVCPVHEHDSVEAIRHYVGGEGFRGIKMHPTANSYRVDSLRMMEPVMKLAAEYDVPVLFHGEDDGCGSPYQFATLAEAFPECKIIVAHMCHGLWLDAIEVCRSHDNIWLDTAECSPHNFKMERAIRLCGPEKIIFGTDTPVTDIGAHLAIFENINTYYPGTLTPEGLEQILAGNIAKLLKMDI